MKNIINILFTILFSIIVIIACDDTSLIDVEYPSENLSYSEHIQPILNLYCSRSGCHSSESMSGGYGTYDWIATNTPPYIIEGDATNSLMYMAITGKGGLTIMPPVSSGITLTEEEILAIKTWINEGAKNN